MKSVFRYSDLEVTWTQRDVKLQADELYFN